MVSACSCTQAPADVLLLWQKLWKECRHFPFFTSLNYNKQRSSFQWRATRRRTQSFWRRETRDRPRVMGNLRFLGPIIGLVPRIAHLWAELWLGTKHGPVTDLKPFTHSAPGWQDQFGLNTFKTMYIGSGSVYPSIVNQSKVLLHSFLSESPRSHDSAESLLQKTGDR